MQKRRKRIIAAVVILLIGVIIFMNIASSQGWFGLSGQATEVQVKAIERTAFKSTLHLDGVVEESEKREVIFNVPVRVEKILVEQYDQVSRGQALLVLDLREYESELERSVREKKIQELNREKIDIIDTSVPDNLKRSMERARKDVDEAREAYEEAARDMRDKEGYDLEKATRKYNQAKKEFEAAESNYHYVVATADRFETVPRDTKKAADIDRQVIDQQIKMIDAQIANLQAQLDNLYDAMISPIEGYITELNIQEGLQTGGAGQKAIVIVNADELRVIAEARPAHIKYLAEEQKVILTGDAIADQLDGYIKQISPVARTKSAIGGEEAIIEVIIALENKGNLIPGLSVKCEVITQETDNALVGSYIMLMDDAEGKYVYVVDEAENVIRKRYIEIGSISVLEFEIIDGLQEGEMVVLNPQPFFRDGMKIRIKQ